METLALSMIIKDEPIDRLVMLMDFIKPFASQFVIADTGSATVERDKPLLESAGATVLQLDWRDDFAWARNQTLEHINTDWVLHLDGDELPSLAMVEYIKEVLTVGDKSKEGVLFFTRNYWGGVLGTEAEYHWHVRMFRSGMGVWYRNVHELVRINGREEGVSRSLPSLLRAPKEAYLIHSKPHERMNSSSELYTKLGFDSR